MKNVNCCSRICFSNTKMFFWTPRWLPKCPKIAPRRLQEGLEKQLFSTSFLPSILVHFGSLFGSLLAPFWAPKIVTKCPKTTKSSLRRVPRRFKRAKTTSERLLRLAKMAQEASKTVEDGSRGLQDSPRDSPNASIPTQKAKIIVFFFCFSLLFCDFFDSSL